MRESHGALVARKASNQNSGNRARQKIRCGASRTKSGAAEPNPRIAAVHKRGRSRLAEAEKGEQWRKGVVTRVMTGEKHRCKRTHQNHLTRTRSATAGGSARGLQWTCSHNVKRGITPASVGCIAWSDVGATMLEDFELRCLHRHRPSECQRHVQ